MDGIARQIVLAVLMMSNCTSASYAELPNKERVFVDEAPLPYKRKTFLNVNLHKSSSVQKYVNVVLDELEYVGNRQFVKDKIDLKQSARVRVYFRLGKEDSLDNVKIVKYSGIKDLDNFTFNAVRKAKLPEIPQDVIGQYDGLTFVLVFNFNVDKNNGKSLLKVVEWAPNPGQADK